MIPYLEMMRPGNCAMSIVAVAIGTLLAAGGNLAIFSDPFSPAYVAMLVVFLVTGAGNVINDYVDREADRINRPKRPIPSGRVSPRPALAFSLTIFGAGIILSGFLTWYALLLAVLNSSLLIIYSYSLQNKILLGNLSVGYLVGSTFLFGGAALGNLYLPALLMMLAMFSTISREIVKDLEDLEGDRKSFMKKIAAEAKKIIGERFGIRNKEAELRVSKKRAKAIAVISMLLAIATSPLPYVLGVLGTVYVVILVPTIIIFFASIFSITRANTRKEFAKISSMIKLGMNIGLLAFIAGVLI
jgi:geranylgeranylglycerol-phosphate geranylgeranyltransferase